ncbi:MAG: hypothetical protein COS84_09645 [Armatimonadetes bacterium CG07_land_8_20_14_0_80_40_9]|nr:MAG: hypothetical protein COS84_09645 [Armatimonadetes bacterium CG07_land_8_20_14_0_80_40_9]
MKHKQFKRWLAVLTLLLLLSNSSLAAGVKGKTAKGVWEGGRREWAKVKSYTCSIFAWGYHTEWFISHFPEYLNKEGKPEKPNWQYRVYSAKFKKPGKFLLSYDLSKNENTETGSIIDRAVALVLLHVPGTLLNYGHKDKKYVYIKFPYIKSLKEVEVPTAWKVAMKVLMIASRKEVYFKTLDNLRDARGYTIDMLALGETMKKFDHYFKDGKVTLGMAPRYTKSDYVLNSKGYLHLKKIKRGESLYQLTMVPNSVKKNRGITKIEAFVDPKTMMFVGLHEYENERLVGVMLFSNLKLNLSLPDSLWSKFFEGREISDKK